MIISAFRILVHMGPLGLARAIYYQLKITLFRDVLKTRYIKKRIFGRWMYLDTRDRGISRTLLLFGRRERDHKLILEKVIRKGMTVLDIGANIGYYALMERQLLGEEGLIVAVEPGLHTAELLKKNIALNGHSNIHVLQMGLSDKTGERTFFVSPLSNLSSFHRESAIHPSDAEVKVETRSVPEIMKDFGSPDLIRMDVEGHEVEIINGMLDAIESGEMSPMIIFEPHIRKYGPDHDIEAPIKRLFAAGYKTRYVASSSKSGTERINSLGYRGSPPIRTDFLTRTIYEDLSDEHLLDLLCRTGGLRTILLARESEA